MVPRWSTAGPAAETSSSGDSCIVVRVPRCAAVAPGAGAWWPWKLSRALVKPELPDDDELLMETSEWGRLLPLRTSSRDARNFTAATDNNNLLQWRFWHSKSGGYFGANINMGEQRLGMYVRKEQFYSS